MGPELEKNKDSVTLGPNGISKPWCHTVKMYDYIAWL